MFVSFRVRVVELGNNFHIKLKKYFNLFLFFVFFLKVQKNDATAFYLVFYFLIFCFCINRFNIPLSLRCIRHILYNPQRICRGCTSLIPSTLVNIRP